MIPVPQHVKYPLLLLIRMAGGDTSSLRAGETYEVLADVLGVSDAERKEQREKNQGSVWHSRVQNARKALVEGGLVEPLNGNNTGEWKLTASGRQKADALLASEPKLVAALRSRLGHRPRE
jgi:hypothetical protein